MVVYCTDFRSRTLETPHFFTHLTGSIDLQRNLAISGGTACFQSQFALSQRNGLLFYNLGFGDSVHHSVESLVCRKLSEGMDVPNGLA